MTNRLVKVLADMCVWCDEINFDYKCHVVLYYLSIWQVVLQAVILGY